MNGVIPTPSGDSNLGWKFNSLVCFDLETTGLPQYDGKVKITELALVGIVRSHINSETINSLPRVLHKLCFTVYPQKAISFDSSRITGLWNDTLEHIKPWNINTYEMLLAFLNLLPAPVCIVAHNGYKFDFPIFEQHLKQIDQVLPDHFIFMDSLPAFQKILRDDVSESSSHIERMIEDMESDNDNLIRVAEEVEAGLPVELASKYPQVTPDSIIVPENQIIQSKMTNNVNSKAEVLIELASKHPQVTPNSKIVPKNQNTEWKMINSDNSTTEIPSTKKSKVRRSLFPAKKPASFKLTDIYSHLHNQPSEGAHNAEEDAITLLKCILKIAPEFLKYADNNHKILIH